MKPSSRPRFRSFSRSGPLLLAALLGAPLARAATTPVPQWTIGNGVMHLLGCYGTPAGVQCDIDYTLVQVDAGLLALSADDLTYTTTDGRSGEAKSVSIQGSAFAANSRLDSFKDKPIRATFRLPLPASTASLQTLEIVGHRLANVAVSKTAAPTRPAAATPAPVTSPAPSGSASISGTVRAGGDLYGAVVYACVRQGDGCDEKTIRTTQISSTGPEATYTISGLDRALHYTVFAWLDADFDGDITSGDLLGTYDAGSRGTPVSAPHAHTDFSISPIE